MVHVLSASVLCEHNIIITARGSVDACRGCHVFEGFHFRHYFSSTCRNSTYFYDAHCLFIIFYAPSAPRVTWARVHRQRGQGRHSSPRGRYLGT